MNLFVCPGRCHFWMVCMISSPLSIFVPSSSLVTSNCVTSSRILCRTPRGILEDEVFMDAAKDESWVVRSLRLIQSYRIPKSCISTRRRYCGMEDDEVHLALIHCLPMRTSTSVSALSSQSQRKTISSISFLFKTRDPPHCLPNTISLRKLACTSSN